MGSHLSIGEKKIYKQLAERFNNRSVKDFLEARKLEPSSTFVSADDTLENSVAKLTSIRGNAALVVDPKANNEVIGTLDVFMVLDYMLELFEGSLRKVETHVIHKHPDPFWYPWYWDEFDTWCEKHVNYIPTTNAPNIVQAGAVEFFSASVRTVLESASARKHARVMHPSQAISSSALILQMLPVLAGGVQNVVVKDDETKKLYFVSSFDILDGLRDNLVNNNLEGFGSLSVHKLGLDKKPVLTATAGERALLIFRKMSASRVMSVPIVDEVTNKLKAEFSLETLRGVHAANFGVVMGTCAHVLESLDPKFSGTSVPYKCSSKSTILEVVDIMWNSRRTHVWILNDKEQIEGVVSLTDIFNVLSQKILDE